MITCEFCKQDVAGEFHAPNCAGKGTSLHVRTAAALGWIGFVHVATYPDGSQWWKGYPSEEVKEKREGRGGPIMVPEWDRDHEKWGLLIEKHEITIRCHAAEDWTAYTDFSIVDGEVEYGRKADGKTVGEAICNLLCLGKA